MLVRRCGRWSRPADISGAPCGLRRPELFAKGQRTLGLLFVLTVSVGCTAPSKTDHVAEQPRASSLATLRMPRSPLVDCRFAAVDSIPPERSQTAVGGESQIALEPGRYALELGCSRDSGTWWTPSAAETRHRFVLEVQAGRSYRVEMGNAAAGALKWSELAMSPLMGWIVDAEDGRIVARELARD